jgi:hypothetical protein
MQLPPLTFWSISLWLGMTAIILLITVQLMSSYDGPATVLVNTKRLRYAALILGLLFFATIVFRIYGIVTST